MFPSLSSEPLDRRLDPKEFAAQTGMSLRGVSCISKVDGWQILLRAVARDRTPMYAMISAQHDLMDGLHTLLSCVYSRNGRDFCRKDRFA